MPKRKRSSASLSRGNISWVFAWWLVGIFAATALGRIHMGGGAALLLPIDFEATLLQVAGVCWPMVYFLLSSHRFFPKYPPLGVLISIGLFCLFSGFSAFASPDPYTSIGYLIFTIWGIWVVLQFNTNMTAADFDKAFRIYSILISLAMASYTFLLYTPNVRLGEDAEVLNPNSIAMICMSGFIAAFAFENFMLKIIFVSINATVLVLTGSRASAAGLILAIGVFLWSRRKEWSTTNVIMFWLILIYLTTILILWWNSLMGPVKDYFLLQDRSRGLATGSGRFVLWQEAWELFLSNPLFGVGYRVHEGLMPSQASAHNGYLAILAEIGIVGSAALVYPIWRGITFLRLKNTFEPAVCYAVLIALCIAYLYVALFERYLINFGNPTSLVFLIAIFAYLIPSGERTTWRSFQKIGRNLKL
jgi:hypothetical protein